MELPIETSTLLLVGAAFGVGLYWHESAAAVARWGAHAVRSRLFDAPVDCHAPVASMSMPPGPPNTPAAADETETTKKDA